MSLAEGSPDVSPRSSQVLVADPFGRPAPSLVVAAARAGALGVLDIDGADAATALTEVLSRTTASFAVRTDGSCLDRADLSLPRQVDTVILTPDGWAARDLVARAAFQGRRVLATVLSKLDGDLACKAGVDGLVAKGAEAGGKVGDTDAFLLLQQLVAAHPGRPVWIQGGVGLYTAAAAIATGAEGVVLDSQLALVRESHLDDRLRRAIRAMDGSETRVVAGYRLYTRPDLPVASLSADTPAAAVEARLGTDLGEEYVPVGQDAATASVLADRYATVGGVVTALLGQIRTQIASARASSPLLPGAGVATTNGTRYPVVQGPMTRVSDQPAFAAAVAEGGGLPFLALALLRADEVRPLLAETAALLGDRPWGVGILGFVPPELREEQLEVIREVRPPVALIAGGRPAQAAPLEAEGIRTYLHAPSPGLIEQFASAGARRFVFEGRACGGHVGPRSSFALWEAAIERLVELDCVAELDLLFAGGIHDARSAAAVATLATPLTDRGARVGVLMGTAYLFTAEAVESGAIMPAFQAEALACDRTVLLETAPGHATRCAPSPYVQTFGETRARLEASGASHQDVWSQLETLNLGRLRIASKGIARDGGALLHIDDDQARDEGMFMIGDVATLRDEVTTIADLHEGVTNGASEHLRRDDVSQRAGQTTPTRRPARLDVAIVGMAALMPGAGDTEQFWSNVLAGVDSVTEVPPSRWDVERYYDANAVTVGAGRKTPSKWGGFLGPVGFDALAYGIPPRSLASIEPAQLLALEVASRALRDAGYETREFDRSRASVIFGAEAGTDLSAAYGLRATLPSYLAPGNGHGPLPPELEEHLPELTEDSFPGILTNVIAGRIANRLDLGGVNYTVDAACAASLAALDLACKELVSGTSDLVLCGGVDLHNSINDYLMFAAVRALAPNGRCRTFDASADGIALGEGVACVALKRLEDAERDGDRVYAVVEAVGGSSDGRALGLTAPRADGQRRALRRALAQADRSPVEIGLIEAHGTGTVVGDATELGALTELFTEHDVEAGSCVLGSVKSQIGHTKCTAGLAGLIKTAHALYHGVLPPTIHLDDPNPGYDEQSSPFRFATQPQPWLARERRAGVSAFGFGGTNFHAVLSSYAGAPEPRHGAQRWPAELVMVRAHDAASAQRQLATLGEVVGRIVDADPRGERHALRDVAQAAYRLGDGPVQVAIVAYDLVHLDRLIADALDGSSSTRDGVFVAADDGTDASGAPDVAFLFPGQGSQRIGMLGDLFVAFPELRAHLRADESTAARIFPPAAFGAEVKEAQRAALTDTRVAQPALGLVERALVGLLDRAGVRPAAAAGHSYGELVALATAGALDDDGLSELSHARGRAVADAAAAADDPGAMAAVNRSSDALTAVLAAHPGVVVANHNSSRECVLSGPTAAIEAAVSAIAHTGASAKRLPVACAFHSPLVAGARDELAQAIASVALEPLRIPVWSNTSAEPYPGDPALAAELLADQVGLPVRFREQIESMYQAGHRVFLEVGPGRVLTGLVRDVLGDRPHRAIACDVRGDNGIRRFLLALAELAIVGVPVDPSALFAERAHEVQLSELPRPAPQWTVDGHLVRTSGGAVVPGGLRPATENPVIGLGSGPAPAVPAEPTSQVVAEYLRNLRETVAAERDVMLQFLGSTPVARATVIDVPATVPAAPVIDSVPPVPAAAAEPVGGRPTGEELLDRILEIVSERTGYPREMLDPDLDLESDLSIDSIKRIEIIGELGETIGLAGAGRGLDNNSVEELAQLKTLRGVVEWIDAASRGAETPAPPNGSQPVGGQPTGEELLDRILEIVSERTGYPREMLDPDLDLESDLSIDSIKRIEIIGELGETIGLAGAGRGLDNNSVEELAQLKTLRGVVEWIDAATRGADTAPASPPDAEPVGAGLVRDGVDPSGDVDGADHLAPDVPLFAVRAVVEEVPVDDTPVVSELGQGARCLVVDDGSGIAPGLAGLLHRDGVEVTLVDADGDVGTIAGAADAVIVIDLADRGAPAAFDALAPAALAGARWLGCVVATDAIGGQRGLARALHAELPSCTVRSLAVPVGTDPSTIARWVRDELGMQGPTDVRRDGATRLTRHVSVTPRLDRGDGSMFDPGAVVLLTGGARGITARCSIELARAGAAHLHLIGRTPLPMGAEAPDLLRAPDERSLRQVLLARGVLRTPAAIDAEVRRILGDREIRATLTAAADAGSEVHYRSLDVKDSDALAEVVEACIAQHGRLDGIIHGAGVIEDRYLRDKTAESYRRVFDTKVGSARALLDAASVAAPDVGFVVLFGSVSGVFGNKGQVDYSAANDALDALAINAPAPLRGRVLAIDWGPWGQAGMVSDELARSYSRLGIGLIDPVDGVDALREELAHRYRVGTFADPQVVVARALPSAFAPERRDESVRV